MSRKQKLKEGDVVVILPHEDLLTDWTAYMIGVITGEKDNYGENNHTIEYGFGQYDLFIFHEKHLLKIGTL